MHPSIKRVTYSPNIERSLVEWKIKDRHLFERVTKQIEKIIREPAIGKPLRHSLKNFRRVHAGSLVLVYELRGAELRFLDLDHHDKIYKR